MRESLWMRSHASGASPLRTCDDPAFGLRLGAETSVRDWGLVGYAVAFSSTSAPRSIASPATAGSCPTRWSSGSTRSATRPGCAWTFSRRCARSGPPLMRASRPSCRRAGRSPARRSRRSSSSSRIDSPPTSRTTSGSSARRWSSARWPRRFSFAAEDLARRVAAGRQNAGRLSRNSRRPAAREHRQGANAARTGLPRAVGRAERADADSGRRRAHPGRQRRGRSSASSARREPPSRSSWPRFVEKWRRRCCATAGTASPKWPFCSATRIRARSGGRFSGGSRDRPGRSAPRPAEGRVGRPRRCRRRPETCRPGPRLRASALDNIYGV